MRRGTSGGKRETGLLPLGAARGISGSMDPRRDPRMTVYEPRSAVRRIGAWAARAPWGRLAGPLLGAVLVGGSFALDWFEEPETEWELGLVAVSREGVTFTQWPELRENYQIWVREERRREAGLCLEISPEQRERLIAEAPGGRVLAFAGVDLGEAGDAEGCGGRECGAAEIDFDTLGWVPCGVDAFVANRFACPGRPPSRVVSEPPLEGWDHYPLEARRAGQQGTARVRVTRDQSGTPTACAVLASSGHAALDRQTCRLVGTAPLFTPDELEAPERIGEAIVQNVTWRLEGERR
jgi:TonB family protein